MTIKYIRGMLNPCP